LLARYNRYTPALDEFAGHATGEPCARYARRDARTRERPRGVAAALTLAKKLIRSQAAPPSRSPNFECSGKRVLFPASENATLIDSALPKSAEVSSVKSSLAKQRSLSSLKSAHTKENAAGPSRTWSVPDA